jgi:putative peptidoglycan lipid II flippase
MNGIVGTARQRAWRAIAGIPSGAQILRAAIVVARGFVIVTGAGALRELLVARQFGTSDAIDAYLIALVLPMFCLYVFAGSFDAAVVPSFVAALQNRGREAAHALFAQFLAFAILLLVGSAIVLIAIFPLVVHHLASSFGPAKIELTLRLFHIVVAVIVVGGIASVLSATLSALESFSLVSLTPALTPLLMSALLLGRHGLTIEQLAAVYLIGGACETSVLAVALWRRGLIPVRIRFRVTDETRGIIRQYATMVIGVFLMLLTVVVDQTMAAMLGAGAPASLNYAAKVVGFGTGIATVAVGTAVMPYFSRMVAAARWGELRHALKSIVFLILAITIPIAAILAFFSIPIVRLLFERGAFGAHDTLIVGRAQRLLCLEIPFYAASIPVVRAISALRANQILAIGAALNLTVNCTLNYILMKRMGIAGIALSTSIVYAVSFTFLIIMLARLLAVRAGRHE